MTDAIKPEPVVGGVPLSEVGGCTCLRLRRAARRITQIYDHALAPTGLSIGQFSLLAHLHDPRLERRGLAVGVLADRLGMDPTTLNRNLKPLEALGLVASRPDAQDRRVRIIVMTASGAKKLGEAARLWRQAQGVVIERLGAEGTSALNGILDRSITRLSG